MRRWLALFLMVTVMLIPALAQAETTVRLVVDGVEVQTDVPPVIENMRTLVPVRAVTEALGFQVEWDQETRTATLTKGETTIQLTEGSPEAMVNGEKVTLDVAPFIVSGRMMVPVRFVAEQIGLHVDWDQETRTVLINSHPPDEEPAETEESEEAGEAGETGETGEAEQPAEPAGTIDPAAFEVLEQVRATAPENARLTGEFTVTVEGGLIPVVTEMSFEVYTEGPDRALGYNTVRAFGVEQKSGMAVYNGQYWKQDETGAWVQMPLEKVTPADALSDPSALVNLNPAEIPWVSATLTRETYEEAELQVVTLVVDKTGLIDLVGEQAELVTDARMEIKYWLNDDYTPHHMDLYIELALGEPEPVRMVTKGTVLMEPWEGTIEFPPEITGAAE